MRILFISHQLSLTGAPMVLLDVIRFCLKEGYSVDVRYFTDGDLRPSFEELGVRLIHQEGFDAEKAEEFVFAAREYDLIWANTIVCNQAIHLLNLIDKPVIWWLHEGPAYFDLFASSLPDFAKLRPGIHILAVSPRVRKLGMYRYNEDWELFPFMVADTFRGAGGDAGVCGTLAPQVAGRVRFLFCGTIGVRKGVDVLCAAYRLLPPQIRKQIQIDLYGNPEDSEKDVMQILRQTEDAHFRFWGSLPHAQMLEEIRRSDYVISPSRDDPMPTVTAEGWMCGVPAILSDACGISEYMEVGKEGFVFPSMDYQKLAEVMEKAVLLRLEQPEKWQEMGAACRALYDAAFSPEVFYHRLSDKIHRLTNPNRPGLVFCTGGIDILDIFSYELMREFGRMGYECLEMNNTKPQESLAKLGNFLPRPIKAVISFNHLMQNLELVPGKNLWEQIGACYINILMDHPFVYREDLDRMPAGSVQLCIDRNHMDYIRRFHPSVGTYGFLAHGGKNLRRVPVPIRERTIGVMYAGSLTKYALDRIKPDFASYPFPAEEICEKAVQRLIRDPSVRSEVAIEDALRETGVLVSDDEMSKLITEFRFVDLTAVSYYREKAVQVLAEAGVHVTIFGTGWEKCEWTQLLNVDMRGRVSADTVVEAMQNARIVLNTLTWFKDGAHDRIFNGMLSGAVVVTDSSKYLKEIFSDEELLMFELPEVETLPEKVGKLLEDPDRMQRMADAGRMEVLEHHTWEARARELEEGLLKDL